MLDRIDWAFRNSKRSSRICTLIIKVTIQTQDIIHEHLFIFILTNRRSCCILFIEQMFVWTMILYMRRMISMKNKKKLLSIISITTLTLLLCITVFSLMNVVTASTDKSKSADTDLSYISVPISSNDTLWSIAEEYYTDDCGSITNYINEIKRCNALTSDEIYAGNNIIIPLYIRSDSQHI